MVESCVCVCMCIIFVLKNFDTPVTTPDNSEERCGVNETLGMELQMLEHCFMASLDFFFSALMTQL